MEVKGLQHYFVSPEGLKEIESQQILAEGKFSITLFAAEEWKLLNGHLASAGSAGIDRVLGNLNPQGNSFNQRFERLHPSLFFIGYSDFADDTKEFAIYFFLSANDMTILRNDRLELPQINDWARRGLLTTPSDLAQLLGMEILEHHQRQLELLEDDVDRIEENILETPERWQRSEIINLHKKILGLKKSLNAHQTIFSRLAAMDNHDQGKPSWKDLVADTQQKLENARQTHELIEILMEAYQQAIDNRANDIMKVLTLLATILLPINLVTSFFGMNFEAMPLIHSPLGMPLFFGVSVLIVTAVLILFWRKHWLR
jgi:Mg2+ and Co2+ transporters